MPVGFTMFGPPALSHIPLANVAEYFLLIIIYCVTLLLFVQAFNTHSIHSIELVAIFIFLTLCALSTLHTIIRYYYPLKCISLYDLKKNIQFFPKIIIDFIYIFFLFRSLFCIFTSYSFAYLQKDIVFENYVNAVVNKFLSILLVGEGLYA